MEGKDEGGRSDRSPQWPREGGKEGRREGGREGGLSVSLWLVVGRRDK